MVDSKIFPGRRRGIPQEEDCYAPKKTHKDAARRAKALQKAAQAKVLRQDAKNAQALIAAGKVKGACPICFKHIGRGIIGHVQGHIDRGEATCQPSDNSTTESKTTASTEQT